MACAVHSGQTTVGFLPPPSDGIGETPRNLLGERVVDILSTGQYFGDPVIREISAISADDLKQMLAEVCEEMSQLDDPLDAIERLSTVLPLENVQDAIRTEYPQHVDALKTARDMLHSAQYYLEKTEEKTSCCSLCSLLSSIYDCLISVLESIINSFGIASFFKPAENDWDADMKGHKLLSISTTFSMLSAALMAVVDAAICGIIVGSILVTIAALSLIYPYIRPTPSYLPGAENWSRQIQQGELTVEEGRKPILDEIAHLLIADSNVTTHPLLIGKSGVGKTETVKAFSQAVERGDYPELDGKKVFYFNSASLVNHTEMFGNGNRILSKINEAIGSNRDNVILVFDEIHLTCQKKENSDIAEQLKTLLDSGPHSFPHVIGITTEEEFYRDIYVNNAAFARRFKRINIDNTTEQETLEILSNYVLAHAPNTILGDDSLYTLIQKVHEFFPTAPEPSTSLKILSKCIQRTAESQESELEKQIKEVQGRIRFFSSQGAVGRRASILPYQRDPNTNIDQLTMQLQELQEQLRAHTEDLSTFYEKREAMGVLKKTMFRTILKVSNFERTALSERNKRELNTFLLLSHFLLPAMENNIQEEAQRLGVLTAIDPDLIEQVIEEELENDRKVQEAVARGKAQIKEREKAGSSDPKKSEEIED